MTSYQKAIKALEECVKDAMENNVDPGLQMEIWRHYQGMKAIDRQLPKQKEYKFSLADDQISIQPVTMIQITTFKQHNLLTWTLAVVVMM